MMERSRDDDNDNLILDINPGLLVIVEGLEYAGTVEGARERPLQVSGQAKLVYSGHLYSFCWDSTLPYPEFSHQQDPDSAYWSIFIFDIELVNTTPVCSLIITLALITMKQDTFMYRLNMCLKTTLACSLIITLITMIQDTFMFRLNMFLKKTLVCSLIITPITSKSQPA